MACSNKFYFVFLGIGAFSVTTKAAEVRVKENEGKQWQYNYLFKRSLHWIYVYN